MLCAGQVYRATLTVHNQTGAPSSVALAITKPDGTAVTPPPVPPAGSQVGTDWVVNYDYTLPSPGLYKFAWVTQGPGTAPFPEFINVRDFISIVSMAEVKQHLNKTTTEDDDELASYLMASTELVEDRVGICVPRSFTCQVDDGKWELVLPYRPVISVQSVTSIWSGGAAWADPSLFAVDNEAGIVRLAGMMPFWWGPWNVVLTAGRQQVNERWVHAAKEQIRHLWDTQRGAMPPALLQGEEVFTSTTGFTFSIPRRVLELLETDMVPSI